MPDLGDTIEAAAAEPASVSGPAGSTQQRPLGELIEADKHLQGKEAQKRPLGGISLTRVIPPGTV